MSRGPHLQNPSNLLLRPCSSQERPIDNVVVTNDPANVTSGHVNASLVDIEDSSHVEVKPGCGPTGFSHDALWAPVVPDV